MTLWLETSWKLMRQISGQTDTRLSPPPHTISRDSVSLLTVTELDGLQPGVEPFRVRQHRPGAHPPQEAVGAGPAHVQQVGRPLPSPRGDRRRRRGGRASRTASCAAVGSLHSITQLLLVLEWNTLHITYMVIGCKVKSAIWSIFGWYGTEWGFI